MREQIPTRKGKEEIREMSANRGRVASFGHSLVEGMRKTGHFLTKVRSTPKWLDESVGAFFFSSLDGEPRTKAGIAAHAAVLLGIPAVIAGALTYEAVWSPDTRSPKERFEQYLRENEVRDVPIAEARRISAWQRNAIFEVNGSRFIVVSSNDARNHDCGHDHGKVPDGGRSHAVSSAKTARGLGIDFKADLSQGRLGEVKAQKNDRVVWLHDSFDAAVQSVGIVGKTIGSAFVWTFMAMFAIVGNLAVWGLIRSAWKIVTGANYWNERSARY